MFSHTSKIAIATFSIVSLLLLLRVKKQHPDKDEPSLAEQLPDEMLFKMFEYLKPDELVNASAVSTRWCKVADDKVLWTQFSFLSREEYVKTKRSQDPEVLNAQQILNATYLLHQLTKNIKIHLLGSDDSHKEFIFNLNRPYSETFQSRAFFGSSPRREILNGCQFNIFSTSDGSDAARKAASKDLTNTDVALICITNKKDFSAYQKILKDSSNSSIFFLYVVCEDQAANLLADKNLQTIIFSQGDTLQSFLAKVIKQIEHIAKSEQNSFWANFFEQLRMPLCR